MRPFDLRAWHLLAASSLALTACQNDEPDQYAESFGYDGNYDGVLYECYYWTNCGLGSLCVANECETAPEAIECVYESLVEIPLPELEPILALALADLDGVGGDELIGIGVNGVSVVLADDSVVLTPWPEAHEYDWVTPLELQGDEWLDLAVGFPGGMLLLAGAGDGTFTALATHQQPDVEAAMAIDPEGDGIDQLIATQSAAAALLWFSDVTANIWTPTDAWADSLTIANVGDTEILADMNCGLKLIDATDFDDYRELGFGELNWRCDWHVAALAGHQHALVSVGTDANTPRTQLTVFDAKFVSATASGRAARIPNMRARASTLVDLHGAGEPVLVLGDDSNLALVWDWSHFPEPCIERLEGAADSVHAGDRDGDGRQELAVSHAGAIRLLHLP